MPQKTYRRWPDFAVRKNGKVFSGNVVAQAAAMIEKGSGKGEPVE